MIRALQMTIVGGGVLAAVPLNNRAESKMSRKLLIIPVAVLSLIALAASSAMSRSQYLDKVNKRQKTLEYSFMVERAKLWSLSKGDPELAANSDTQRRVVSVPLGSANVQSPNTVPGVIVDRSYEDWQWSQTDRGVDFRGTPDVHFAYMDQTTPTFGFGDLHGYNVYDPIGGNWPLGAETGCEIGFALAGDRGRWPTMDVNSDGLIVIAGTMNTGFGFENRIDFQTTKYSCFGFGSNSPIPPSQYTINMGNSASIMNRPGVEYQEWAGDTVIHIVGNESTSNDLTGTGKLEAVIQHFYKVGKSAAGAWIGPQTIDTSAFRATISASRVSPKVAIFYTHITPLGYTLPSIIPPLFFVWTDLGIVYRESDSLGIAWNVPVEITPQDRTVPSWNPRKSAKGLYDSEDGLHIIWEARPQPANVYDDSLGTFFFTTFIGSLFHWSDRTGVISKVVNGDYDRQVITQICGTQGSNLYLDYASMGECDGNLYVTWSQVGDWFDVNNRGHQSLDDCSSDTSIAFIYNANADIHMSVSSSLDGVLWDFQRNLTDTYTPNCDSAVALGGNGVCGNETKPSLSRYGMDEAAMTATFGTLTWPAESSFDPSGSYAGDHYLQLFYLDDKFSGNASLFTTFNSGPYTLNPLRWVRLACVDPVLSPQIAASPASTGFPEHVDPGLERVITVTITNDGNTLLNISEIQTIEDDGPPGWLGASVSALTVPAGISNTGTFDMILNAGGLINSPGTIVALNGRIRLISDAPAPLNQVDIEITNFIVGPVADLVLDSVSNNAIQLEVSSHGEMGNSKNGGANMDFVASGLECDPAQNVYLFSGSPLMIQKVDSANGVFKLSTNLFAGGFAPSYAFRSVSLQAVPGSFVGPGGSDAFNTGTFVNWDSSIAVEQTYYAPSASENYVLVKTQYFSNDGLDHANLLLGDVIDWDTPSDPGTFNSAGIIGKTVYLQGVNTNAIDTGCTPMMGRFSASTFLGMHDNTELNNDGCANNSNLYGVYASENGGGNLAAGGAPNGALDSALVWNESGLLIGQWVLEDTALDQRITQTYVHDYTLGATDTLTVYTALVTLLNGTEDDLDASVKAACDWYNTNLRPGCVVCSCCKGSTGNIDNDPNDITDIADLTFLIDHLFINFPALDCAAEGNIDGDPAGIVDIADLTFLIDHLFINFPPTAVCQ